MANRKFLMIAAAVSLLLSAPAVASERTWYDGGSVNVMGYIVWDPTCPIAKESPAATYQEIKDNTGSAQLIDRGDEVEVKADDGEVYDFFKTKDACERHASQLSKEKQQHQKQEQQFHNRYD